MTAGFGHGYTNFYPAYGTLFVTYNSNSATTRIDFTYSAQAANQIASYINQYKYYSGMDIKDNGNAFSATTISTSLPNPKTDIEANGGNYLNESEVMALGTIVANKNYYMSTKWNDYRPILSTNSWYVNAEISHQDFPPFGDYNTVDWSSCTSLPYGPNQGAI